MSRIHNEFDAEEVTIKTFSKAFDKIALFDEQYNFKNWLLTISKNTHIDLVRQQKNQWQSATEDQELKMTETLLDDAPTPEDLLITKQNLAELLKHLKTLKPKYQKMIQLRFFQEMTYQEMADELEEPMNNIKVKLLRAKKLLLESLGK